MTIRLMVLHKDLYWLYRFKRRCLGDFLVFVSDNELEAISSLRELEIDMLLAHESYNFDPRLLPEGCGLVYLTDEPGTEIVHGHRAICEDAYPEYIYQILREVLREKDTVCFRPLPASPPPASKSFGGSKREIRPPFPQKDSKVRREHSLPGLGLAARLKEILDRGAAESARQTPGNDVDDVQFRCAAPAVIKPGKYFTARIMMVREDDAERAKTLAAELGDKVRLASGGNILAAAKGQEFTLRLQSPDLPELDAMEQIRWNGKYAFRDFQILLPGDYDRDQLRLLGRVYSQEVPRMDIKLILEVCSPVPQQVICEKLQLRTAFVSYASKDRSEVSKRLQMVERIRPDMDVFMDRLKLKYGEEYEPRLYREIQDRDLFFLFWSRNAADSDWVKKELAYALEHKPMTQIEPIWLEKIENCPPPEPLRHLHFWDWTQNYMED